MLCRNLRSFLACVFRLRRQVRTRIVSLLLIALIVVTCMHEYFSRTSPSTLMDACPEWPPGLLGNKTAVPTRPDEAPTWPELEARLPEVTQGGHRPSNCIARRRIAILVPYRNRDSHLRLLLSILHPMLRRQQQDYRIFLIEQVGSSTFNRGMLLNIGFVESRRLFQADCVIFHDVDFLAEDDNNIYGCDEKYPIHLSPAIDKFNYTILWWSYFGGVTAMRPQLFNRVNGYSNFFFGWGGEDDDFQNRVMWADRSFIRKNLTTARFKMIKHGHDFMNEPNPMRFHLREVGKKRWMQDGLNSLDYTVVEVQDRRLVCVISVDIPEARIMERVNDF